MCYQGDTSNLEYIVKTQKLENISGGDLKDRIQVEDYKPEQKKFNS